MFGGQSQQRWGDNTPQNGDTLRDLVFSDLSGRVQMTMNARRGGFVILAFFDPSDTHSVATLSALQQMATGYADSKKLAVLALSAGSREDTETFATANGLTFPVGLDYDGYHALLCGITSTPTVFFVNAEGTVLRKSVGFNAATLNGISKTLAEAAGVPAVAIS
jgi:peroxiredoxin